MRPVGPTQLLRHVVQGFLQPALPPSDRSGYRRVQVLVPSAPPVALSIDAPTPLGAGPGRTYDIPPCPPGQAISFTLLPEQQLYACTADGTGFAVIGLLVEYLDGGAA